MENVIRAIEFILVSMKKHTSAPQEGLEEKKKFWFNFQNYLYKSDFKSQCQTNTAKKNAAEFPLGKGETSTNNMCFLVLKRIDLSLVLNCQNTKNFRITTAFPLETLGQIPEI
jgi:hypothetical protein